MVQGLAVAAVVSTLLYIYARKGNEANTPNEQDNVTYVATYQHNRTAAANAAATTSKGNPANPGTASSPESIPFDPNTADSATLVKVGFTPWQARNILRYRAKGGQYHCVEDVKRVFNLTIGQWRHIEPLIRIGKDYQYLADNEDLTQRTYNNTPKHTPGRETENHQDSTEHVRKPKLCTGETIDISTADTTDYQRIPGIGPVYARRLHAYVQRLGGIHSIEQLNDEGLNFLPIGIEQYIRIGQTRVQKMKINRMTVRQLNNHPYISYVQAISIVNRVRTVGPFKSWNELLFLKEFTEEDKARLEPYVEF